MSGSRAGPRPPFILRGRFGPGKPEFSNKASPKIATPPYYAMQTFPLTRKSMGGVAIDMQCRVLDNHKQVIPGLYAVGELTGLAGINGKAALEGTFLGPCIVTGRVAAREVMNQPVADIEVALALRIDAFVEPGQQPLKRRCARLHPVTA